MSYSKKEAFDILSESDHAYLRPDVAIDIAKAFGLKVQPQKERVNTRDPKGLIVAGKQDGDLIEGFDASDLAEIIAHHLNPDFRNNYMGRGFRLRGALRSIESSLAGE